MIYDVKELLPYIYPLLPVTNDFYDIEIVPMKKIPKPLQIQSRLWIYHLDKQFHVEHEVICEIVMDIEAHLIIEDFRNIPDYIPPPHLALDSAYEYGYRYGKYCCCG